MSTVIQSPITKPIVSPAVTRRWRDTFIRMLWKELRVQLPFLGVVVFVMVALGGLLDWLGKNEQWRDGTLVGCSTIFVLLYALGSGAMAYANEREEGTWEFLRRIAAPSSAVCSAKLLAGLSGSLLLASLTWSVLQQIAPLMKLEADFPLNRALLLIALTVVLSQTASLLVKSVLWALSLATLVGVPLVVTLLALLWAQPFRPAHEAAVEAALVLSGAWLLVVSLVIGKFWLAHRWLQYREQNPLAWLIALWNPFSHESAFTSADFGWKRQLGCLVAREWTLARKWLWVGLFTLGIPLVSAFGGPNHRTSLLATMFYAVGAVGCFVMAISPTLIGIWVYQPDQKGQGYRFLADRGVSPPLVWLSKHLARVPVIALLLLLAAVMWLVSELFSFDQDMRWFLERHHMLWAQIAFTGGFVFVSYSAGQFVGQVARSPIIATFLGCVLSGLLMFWGQLVGQLYWHDSLQTLLHPVSLLAQLGPPFVLLVATWLHSRDWLEERNTLAAWSRFAASVCVPFALIYGGVGLHRMASAPKVTRPVPQLSEAVVSVEELRRAESSFREAIDLYDQAWEEFRKQVSGLTIVDRDAADLTQIESTVRQSLPAKHQIEALFHGNNHRGLLELILQDTTEIAFPRWVQLVRELHVRLFAETRAELVKRLRDPLSTWTLRNERYSESLKRVDHIFSLLLQLQAMEAERQQHWEEVFELRLANWRRIRKIAANGDTYAKNVTLQFTPQIQQQLLSSATRCRSPELVRRAIRELVGVEMFWPSSQRRAEEHWAVTENTWDQSDKSGSRFPGLQGGLIGRMFPWEAWRARREFAFSACVPIVNWEALHAVIVEGHTERIRLTSKDAPIIAESDPQTLSPYVLPAEMKAYEGLIGDVLRTEIQHRATIQLLALIAWRQEHGRLPDRLEELIGHTLERLPLHPLTGKPFAWVTTAEEAQTSGYTAWAANSRVQVWPFPFLFINSQSLRGALSVARPDGEGNVWMEFDATFANPFLGGVSQLSGD